MFAFCAQWCVRTNKGQEPARGVLQVLHLWHIAQERRILQHQQQIVLRHPRETRGQATSARRTCPSHRWTVRTVSSNYHVLITLCLLHS